VQPRRSTCLLRRLDGVSDSTGNDADATSDKPHLRLLVRHDDADREFSYTSGAEEALARADMSGWTIVSIRSDWARVF
jgi:hypothetical protein